MAYYDAFGNEYDTQEEASAADSYTGDSAENGDDAGWTLNPDGSTTDSNGNIIVPAPNNDDIAAPDPVVVGDGTIDHIPVGEQDQGGWDWGKIAGSLGLKTKDGGYDLQKILALTGGGLGIIDGLVNKPEPMKSIAELKAGMPTMNASQSFSPETIAMMQRPMQTGSALQRVYAADMASPITPGKGYAEGGDVEPQGALTQAFAGAVQGSEGGQSDLIDARLSPGEYVLDADTVSALGDGNTAAGIAKLDQLRAQLREQKRSAPPDSIPPQAQGPLSYMQGGR